MKKITTTLLICVISSLTLCNLCYAQCAKLLDFDGTLNGKAPYGSLISDGIFLYGVTSQGGTNNYGVIFKIKPDGTSYSKLHEFNNTDGRTPIGSLIYDGTFLYGMARGGGLYLSGVIFKIKPDGTGYSKLLDFSSSSGFSSYGSLFSDGTFLYGLRRGGGTGSCTGGCGYIFKIKLDGTGYTTLFNFAGASNGNGPNGTLISDGIFLYGMTIFGGANDLGTIFKIKPDGSSYSKILDFDGTLKGQHPHGSLISDGTFLFGMTTDGGTDNMGVVFKIMNDGTAYSKLLDFNSTNGWLPNGSLFSDGTFLYGMTRWGGADSMGVVFKIKPDATGYSKLFDFSNVNGSFPLYDCSLISDGNFLYGMTFGGGINNAGAIFKYGISTIIVENDEAKTFNLYPNPNNGKFNITIDNSENIRYLEATIYNMLGEQIYSNSKFNKQSINEVDLSASPKGIYFVKIYDGKRIYTEKIIVQ